MRLNFLFLKVLRQKVINVTQENVMTTYGLY